MNIDLSHFPDTIDQLPAGLALIVVCLLVLQIIFLTVAFTAIFRRPAASLPAPVAAVEKAPEAKPEEKPAPVEIVKTEVVKEIVKEATPDAALQLLGLLQQEARFVDFTQENMGQYSDAEIGAVARVVQEGCRKILNQHFTLAAVRDEEEGKRVTLPKGYDAASIRITGNIVGQAPFTGTLVHRGWKAVETKLPKLTEGHDASIIAAAEVEL